MNFAVCHGQNESVNPPAPPRARFRSEAGRGGQCIERGSLMKKIIAAAFASTAALALAACGDADNAAEEAAADTVEMPAEEAMPADTTATAPADAMAPAADATAAAADAAADAEAAADAAAKSADDAKAAADEAKQ